MVARIANTRRETVMDDEAIAIQLFAEETRHLPDRPGDHRDIVPQRTQSRGPLISVIRRQPTLTRANDGHGEALSVTGIVGKMASRFTRTRSKERPAAGSAVREALHRSLSRTKRECIACFHSISGTSVRVPCGHYFDVPCLLSLVRIALKDETSFPPQCCKQAIPVGSFDPHMDPTLSALYSSKSEEYSTLKRVYCANSRCSQFLGPQRPHFTNVYSCTAARCGTRTCSRCRKEVKPQGNHNCRLDVPDKDLLSLSKKSGWAQCPGCARMIELTTGCFHMTCRCKTQFCYSCSALWKTCQCPNWEEHRLVVRAEEPPLAALDLPIRGRVTPPRAFFRVPPPPPAPAVEQPEVPGPWLLRSRLDGRRGKSAGPVLMGAAAPQTTEVRPGNTNTAAASASAANPTPIAVPPPRTTTTATATISTPQLTRPPPVAPPRQAGTGTHPRPPNVTLQVTVGVARETTSGSDSEAPSVPSPTTKPTFAAFRLPPEVPRRSPLRASAPSALQHAQTHGEVVARGLDAQQRRTRTRGGATEPAPALRAGLQGSSSSNPSPSPSPSSSWSSRKDDYSPLSPTSPASTIDGISVDRLGRRIERLLGAVQRYPCQHQWASQSGRNTCDSCNRGGSSISSCTRCGTRACQRCQISRI